MATSYGSITIVDNSDLGQLSAFLTGSTVKQQSYNGNTSTYYPNWDIEHSGTALLLTPFVYYDGECIFNGTQSNSQISIVWSKVENGTNYGTIPKNPVTTECPEAESNYHRLNRPINLAPNSTGAVYTATITYKPIANDDTVSLTAIATFDLSITSYGTDGATGAEAKMLQLNGTGSHFTYSWDNNLFGVSTITMTAQKSTPVYGVHWYCDNVLVKTINGNPSTDTSNSSYASASPYTTLNLSVKGSNSGTGILITSLSTNFSNNKYAQFKVVEIDSSGTEVNGGLEDYFNIYKYLEAAPGEGAYVSYLTNDEETIVEYNGVPQLGNAISQLYITHNGADDMANWHIQVTDNITSASDFQYTLSNSRDSSGSSTYLNKYGPDIVTVTTMNVTTAMITFTAKHGSYSGNTFTADGEVADLINTFSLSRSASLISHSLRLDTVNTNRAAGTTTYTPATVEIDAIERTGGGTSTYRTAGVIHAIVHLANNSLYNFGTAGSPVYYTSNTDGNPLNLTLSTYGTVKYIETFLGGTYNSTTHTFDNAEDKQKVTISADGVDGDNPWSVEITNPFDSISTTYAYVVNETNTYEIPFKVFEGITDKQVHYKTAGGSATYPYVTATWNGETGANIILKYYNNSTEVSTNGAQVDRIKYTVTANSTNIGSEGEIVLTFYFSSSLNVVRRYTYKAIPEALDAIKIQVLARPSNVFENQQGTRLAQAIITSGVTDLTATVENVGSHPINSITWYHYNNGAWIQIANTGTGSVAGIQVGKLTNETDDTTFVATTNGTRQTKFLQVAGTAVDGYKAFKVVANVSVGGVTEDYTEYINFIDKTDPLQVTLHSTLGLQLTNSQGIGVIYARVTRNNVAIDEIPPDNYLGIGTTAPSNNINTGDFQGKLGYFVYSNANNSNYLISYYYRTATTGDGSEWQLRNSSTCTYHWTFRNVNNEPIASTDSGLAPGIKYIIEHDTNTQFIYLDGNVVSKKLTADVRVTA